MIINSNVGGLNDYQSSDGELMDWDDENDEDYDPTNEFGHNLDLQTKTNSNSFVVSLAC